MQVHSRNIILLVITSILLISFGWVGYIASDDILYAHGARGWLNHMPYVGDTHWSLRHTFVLPVAISFAVFGESEYSLVLVTTAYFLALLLLVYWMVAKVFNANIALATSILIAATPLFTVSASIAGADISELFFVTLSLFLFYSATQRTNAANIFFLAGIAAGFAWLTRETSIGLLLLYAVLFLIGYKAPRRLYWVLAAGFALIACAELLYYWVLQGDPLYRLWIDIDQGRSRGLAIKTPGTGNIEIIPLLNPVLAIFLNDEFGLLYYLALPAAIWGWNTKGPLTDSQHSFLRLTIGLALSWFITKGYLIPGRDLPRYYCVTTLCAAIIVSIWLTKALLPHHPKITVLTATLLIVTNIVAIYVSNREPLFGEKTLVRLAAETSEQIYTDPKTFGSAYFLLRTKGLDEKVSKKIPPADSLYFYEPNNVLQDTRPPGYAEKYRPKKNWKLIRKIPSKRKITGYVIEYLQLKTLVPPRIWQRLNSPNQAVALYRTSQPPEKATNHQ